MDFFLDENLPYSIVEELEKEGFEASHVREQGLRGENDAEVFDFAVGNGAILVTKDLEFGSPEHYPVEKYEGLIVVRLDERIGAQELTSRLSEFISNFGSGFEGKIVVLEDGRYRVREISQQ